jgi:Fur family iron response transcriptional regulator
MTTPCVMPPVERDGVAAILQAYGISPTAQRIEIAAILLERTQHLSADQVLARLVVSDAQVSKATVYNTLGLFAARGLIREVIVDSTKVFYDSNTQPHHHFYNVDDGTLTDFPSGAVVIDELPPAPPGTCMDSVDVVIRVRTRR